MSFYRRWINPQGLVSFRVKIAESDLLVLAEKDLRKEVEVLLLEARKQILDYMERFPAFARSLIPLEPAADAPDIVKKMCEAGKKAKVGPFAAVAGAVAEYVGKGLIPFSNEVIVENGGDIYLNVKKGKQVAIYAGNSPFSGKISVRIPSGEWGLATSSGTVGHSLSLGKADAAVVFAKEAPLADAFATALGNRVKSADDIEPALNWLSQCTREGVLGALVIVGDKLGVWNLEITSLKSS
ncbi:conserved hypothetical protein [Thermosulfidibacter takaii ABI70S6]|uniref:Uncharacterized protein n=1 Tax=Thermosulfidibacter takaii (strain DSM 17441 / JCM 13301 / NBRC 103674 / ABI70S6) TaxID=1298851 RepID=A0A0S3QW64_THET7|nr:UPF0280 family protein [Thermosulfidibacter takaii]BAT72553.1 conserved hypothetical protein [Thermosulfidibacter takaii ABI70S6]